MKNHILTLVFCLCCSVAAGQVPPRDSALSRLTGYAEHANSFGNMVPQEKVYLHFDNTSYFQGDSIWFAGYVVSAYGNRPEVLSRTLYVEMLDPGGVIVERRILPVVDGRCHGNFSLTQLPFRSGFYEVRAYTKYMLNFDERGIFSRVLPVFEEPQLAGDYGDRRMIRYDDKRYVMKRPHTKRERKVNLRLYPEGGNLVAGLASRVAFEATDGAGQPLEVSAGRVVGRDGSVRAEFSTLYDGRGAFDYLPAEGDKAEIEVDGQTRHFPMPAVKPEGVVLCVDNLSSADSVRFSVSRSDGLASPVFGAAVMCGGRLHKFNILDMTDNAAVSFAVPRTGLAAGVGQVVLSDVAGRVVADRLFFTRPAAAARVNVTTDRESYAPYERVTLAVEGYDVDGRPLSGPVSVSVRDGGNEVEGGGSIMTDLLLMSEIRGYVRRPWYYFESDDAPHREALDQLLMVQGWRRYDWGVWSGTVPFELKYAPEQGIEVDGRVIHFSTKKPMTDIQLSVLLCKRGEEDLPDSLRSPAPVGILDVDSLGRFYFDGNLWGKWGLIFSVTNDRDRRKYSRVLLNRAFSPSPRAYTLSEMQVTPVEAVDERRDSVMHRDSDPIADTLLWCEPGDMTERVHHIEKVVVKSRKRNFEDVVRRNRSTAVQYIDMPAELDSLRDDGDLSNHLYELLFKLNDNFLITRAAMSGANGEWNISYKGKAVLCVVDHIPSWETLREADRVYLTAVKSVYVNEDLSVICDYAPRGMSPLKAISTYGCVVFVEIFAEHEVPVAPGRGIRKTWVDGYDTPAEFYMPDYSAMPAEGDYRRTLYWNPSLRLDENGRAEVSFYNNGRCRRMRIGAETVTAGGAIGVFER